MLRFKIGYGGNGGQNGGAGGYPNGIKIYANGTLRWEGVDAFLCHDKPRCRDRYHSSRQLECGLPGSKTCYPTDTTNYSEAKCCTIDDPIWLDNELDGKDFEAGSDAREGFPPPGPPPKPIYEYLNSYMEHILSNKAQFNIFSNRTEQFLQHFRSGISIEGTYGTLGFTKLLELVRTLVRNKPDDQYLSMLLQEIIFDMVLYVRNPRFKQLEAECGSCKDKTRSESFKLNCARIPRELRGEWEQCISKFIDSDSQLTPEHKIVLAEMMISTMGLTNSGKRQYNEYIVNDIQRDLMQIKYFASNNQIDLAVYWFTQQIEDKINEGEMKINNELREKIYDLQSQIDWAL